MLGRQLGRRSWPGPDRIGGGRSALNIVYPLRYFQPCAETFDNSLQFVAPSITNLRETARSFRSKSGIQSWSLCLAGHACRSWMCSGASSDVGCKSPAPVSSLRRRRSPQRSSATRSGGFSPPHASAGKLPWFASLSRRAGGRRHHRVHETLRAGDDKAPGDPSVRRAIETPSGVPNPKPVLPPWIVSPAFSCVNSAPLRKPAPATSNFIFLFRRFQSTQTEVLQLV
jgi:hypothetical protein